MELAAAMPQCNNCHNKAKLGCTNHRCLTCCIGANTFCKAHQADANNASRRRQRDAAGLGEADREAMLEALAADEAIGVVVTGVVDEATEYGYLVRLLVNGYVCEGLLFDDSYAVTVDTLPHDMTTMQLQHITLDTLPTLQSRTGPLFPPASPATPPAAHSKPKVRHEDGWPKGPRSGYVYYTAAMRARAQLAESDEERTAARPLWSTLTEREKAPYMRLAEMDKQRWMREMDEWQRKPDEEKSIGIDQTVVEHD